MRVTGLRLRERKGNAVLPWLLINAPETMNADITPAIKGAGARSPRSASLMVRPTQVGRLT